MPCWDTVSRSSPGKCQTLTYTQSCICWAVALPGTEQIVPQLSVLVLALDSWNYCSGEQSQQPNIFFSMFAMYGFID